MWWDISVVQSPYSGVEDGNQATILYLRVVVQAHRVMDDYERHFFLITILLSILSSLAISLNPIRRET